MCTITVLTEDDYSIDTVKKFMNLKYLDRDAFGMFWINHKSEEPGPIFETDKEYICNAFKYPGPSCNFKSYGILPKKCKFFVLHNRQSTGSDPKYNENNHPFRVGSIIGVHQGMVLRHKEFKILYPVYGNTDSEVAISCLNYNRGFSEEAIIYALREIGTQGLIVYTNLELNNGLNLMGAKITGKSSDRIWEIKESFSTYTELS